MTNNKKTKVKILLHNGTEYVTEVENYNAKAIVDETGTNSRSLVAIGDLVIHRSNIAGVIPADE